MSSKWRLLNFSQIILSFFCKFCEIAKRKKKFPKLKITIHFWNRKKIFREFEYLHLYIIS